MLEKRTVRTYVTPGRIVETRSFMFLVNIILSLVLLRLRRCNSHSYLPYLSLLRCHTATVATTLTTPAEGASGQELLLITMPTEETRLSPIRSSKHQLSRHGSRSISRFRELTRKSDMPFLISHHHQLLQFQQYRASTPTTSMLPGSCWLVLLA